MQQMREAFPWDQAPRYLLRDRDAIYGKDFAAMTRDMGMEEVLTAPRSPWQNPFAERFGGLHPTRVPGPRYGVEPEIVASDPAKLFFLLSAVAYSFCFGQRRAGAPEAVDRRRRGAWCRFLRSVDYTTDTCDAPLSRSDPVRPPLLSLTKLLLIQNAILSRHELPALRCTRRLSEAHTASL